MIGSIKELMIGNQIRIDGIIVTVDERTIFDFNHDGRKKEGVVLDETVLLKCGFENPNKAENTYYLDNWICLKLEDDNWEDISFDLSIDGKYITCVEYLHTLQNICSLLGTHLTFKP